MQDSPPPVAPMPLAHAHDPQALKAVEAELRRLSRRINASLHRHCATRALWRAVHATEAGRDARAWMPSLWTLLLVMAGLVLVLPLQAVWAGVPNGQWIWFALLVVVALAFEWKVLPWLALAGYRFHLMRLESRVDAVHGDAYLVAPANGGVGDFGIQHWRPLRGVEVGDIVMSISDKRDQGLAVVPLRLHGRLPLATWAPDTYDEDTLPPLRQAVKALAQEFDAACERYQATATRIERSRAVRSARYAPRVRDPEAAWADLALAPHTKAQLQGLASAFAQGHRAASRGLLLSGPPGTGKTLVARALAESLDCAFYPVSLPDLKASHVGQSGENVKTLWREALAQPRAVLFVDECEGVFGRRGSVGTDAFAEDIVASFIAQWDGFSKQSSVWVVGATNRRDLIDPAVLSRFEDQVEIGLPDAAQRDDILSRHLRLYGLPAALPVRAAELTAGLSGRDIAGVAKQLSRSVAAGAGAHVDESMLESATRTLRQRGGDGVAAATWDRLVLAEDTLRELQAVAALLKNAEVLQQRGISVPRGLLMYGPPGTGKTLAARTLAHETGLRFIAASTADIKQGYVGQSGQKVRELFERAREAAPSLLFIDELDSVASRRGAQDSFGDEIVGQLLQEMDGAKLRTQHVFVLAATNRIDQLDDAVLSRLPRRICIPLPDAHGIERLLATLLADKPLTFELQEAVQRLAPMVAGASGRDLRDWVEQAEQRAVMRAIAQGDPAGVALELEDFGRHAGG